MKTLEELKAIADRACNIYTLTNNREQLEVHLQFERAFSPTLIKAMLREIEASRILIDETKVYINGWQAFKDYKKAREESGI